MQYYCVHCLVSLDVVDDVIAVCATHPDGAVEWLIDTETQLSEEQSNELQ
jgi:hypothetical protein